MSKLIDLSGQRFGRLTVVARAENIGKQTAWLCKCDCGQSVVVMGLNLKRSNTRSCGCLWKDKVPQTNMEINTRHGESHTKLHRAWCNMRYRCFNTRCKDYGNYGGRGITICDEWRKYEAFRDWSLDNGFEEGRSLDRIDVNGNYCPNNCRWVSEKVQQNNKRNNRYLTFNGVTHTVQEWSDITGIGWTTIAGRLKARWSVEEALTQKPAERNKKGAQ